MNPGISKLSALLDDPEARDLIFGLAHVGTQPAEPPAARLRQVVLDLAGGTSAEQYRSWLSDDDQNQAITLDQVRTTLGEAAISDLAGFVDSSPDAVAWQLAVILPDLVDAMSPGGQIVDVALLERELAQASLDDDRSAGAFGE